MTDEFGLIEDDDSLEIVYVMDDDYIIRDGRRGYEAYQSGRLVWACSDREAVFQAVQGDMDQNQFWPNVWYQGERGDMNLLDGMGNYA